MPQDVFSTKNEALKDCESVSVSSYLKKNTNNIIHNTFYDIDNPVEEYYYNLISQSKRVILWPYKLGYTHGEGCVYIGDSDLFREKIVSSLNKSIEFDSNLN